MNEQKDSVSEGVSEAAPERWPNLEDCPRYPMHCDCEPSCAICGFGEHTQLHTIEHPFTVHQPPEQNPEDKNSGGRCTCGHRCPSKQEWMNGAQCVHAEDCELMQTKASSRSTDRVSKDIQLTLAEIRERQRVIKFAYEGQPPPQAQKDVTALLSIIDTPQRGVSADQCYAMKTWDREIVPAILVRADYVVRMWDGRMDHGCSLCTEEENASDFICTYHRAKTALAANPITQDGASASALSQNVPDESSVQHEP